MHSKTGVTKRICKITRGKAALNLLSRMDNNAVQVNSYIVSKITSDLPVTPIDQSVWNTFKDLDLADPSFHQPNKIDLLLSCDVMFAMIKNGKIQCGNVIAQNTTFGWVIGGRAQVVPEQSTITTFHNIVHIDKQLQRFKELEEMFPSANRLTAEEAACEQYFIDSNHRAEDGRYTVNQPIKQTPKQFHRWKGGTSNLRIGTLVTIKDKRLPPSKWLVGRVMELHPGKDNLFRVVTIRTRGGSLKRPINQLCILMED
jgi:hypothetical protein